MPRVFDNIDQSLLPALREALEQSDRADFCIGYFNLRGWKSIDDLVARWDGGEGRCCRLLVGMQVAPVEQLRTALSVTGTGDGLDNQEATQVRKRLAREFRDQLMVGVPTNEDEAGLRRLAAQLRGSQLKVRLFLRHPLHAKLYMMFRPDPVSPAVGFVGSSNLTLAGLAAQGELNLDVLDHDACMKLSEWFDARWSDRWCIDISEDLLEIIEESWARETPLAPYHIYLKIAYHLAREARAGLTEFRIPRDFGNQLFEFQVAAVKIAAHHLNKRGGVLIGDVVGLGKTLMACAVARIFEDDHGLETLIICPKNLVGMWQDYAERYRMRARVVSVSRVLTVLPTLRRYRLAIIDESHNLRNREGKRYRAIQDYLRENETRVILLTATPYNKTYVDLSNQLRLFIPEDADVGVRPEALLKGLGETEFVRRHQCGLRTLAAFEKSEHADDWRELMRLFLVRRTRSFIQDNYTAIDEETGRRFLTLPGGEKTYFPVRRPRTVKFAFRGEKSGDQYALLYSRRTVGAIGGLKLPRYGLGNYIDERPENPPTAQEGRIIADLARAGRRLMGFCRTNLFKRLESGGQAFLLSVERHVLRNSVYLHALAHGKDLPIGPQDAGLLDARLDDTDEEGLLTNDAKADQAAEGRAPRMSEAEELDRLAAQAYRTYEVRHKSKFRWLPCNRFTAQLTEDLQEDNAVLLEVINECGEWDSSQDAKVAELITLLTKQHPEEKVIVFSQFADTINYLAAVLEQAGVSRVAAVTGDTTDPTGAAWRFSPVSNEKRHVVPREEEVRVLLATDVLSEGQNLQDGAIVVNFDLPWAIIRLIQRAGRVDRIGQRAESIVCYSFLPADGVERIIRLRARVRQRLRENAEVVGTDESFFEDDQNDQAVRDLFTENAGILDGEEDQDVDLSSYAFQIWKNATDDDPALLKLIPSLPDLIYSAKADRGGETMGDSVLVYARTGQDNDALALLDAGGDSITESQFAILRAARCGPETRAVGRHDRHHEIVRRGIEHIGAEERVMGGQLGRPSGARFRVYERLKGLADDVAGSLFDTKRLREAIEDIYTHPLRPVAVDTLNRQLRAGASDDDLVQCVLDLREDGRLTRALEDGEHFEPEIICSLGLRHLEAKE